MELLSISFSVLSAWALTYVAIYYRKYEYHRYMPVLVYVYMISVGVMYDVDMLPLLGGLLMSMLTAWKSYVPIIGDGHKVYEGQ